MVMATTTRTASAASSVTTTPSLKVRKRIVPDIFLGIAVRLVLKRGVTQRPWPLLVGLILLPA